MYQNCGRTITFQACEEPRPTLGFASEAYVELLEMPTMLNDAPGKKRWCSRRIHLPDGERAEKRCSEKRRRNRRPSSLRKGRKNKSTTF